MSDTYRLLFPNKSLQKKFLKVLRIVHPVDFQDTIIEKVQGLKSNPRPHESSNFRSLRGKVRVSHYTAQYRLRIGNYRILYDVDDNERMVWILALRKRGESTYK